MGRNDGKAPEKAARERRMRLMRRRGGRAGNLYLLSSTC